MALPKRRHSRSRSRLRRTHDSLREPSLSICPNCGQEKVPHRACDSCGHYKGRKVIEIKEES